MKKQHFQIFSCLAIAIISSSCRADSSDVPLNSQYHSAFENLSLTHQKTVGALTTLDNKNKNLSKNRSQDSSANFEFLSNDLLLVDRRLAIEHDLEITKSANGTCLITLRYPQFHGLSDETRQAAINQKMREEIKNSSSYFFSTIQENKDCTIETELDTWHLEFDPCIVEFSDGDFVSLACQSVLAGRSAYPLIHTVGINVNLRTGRFYQFDDLFNQQSAYREKVNQLLLEQGSWSDIDAEILSNSEIERVFYLRSDCSDFSIQSTCFVIPTNFSSGPARGVILFIDIEDVRKFLNKQASNLLLN